jgi:hypothetical protein
MEPVITTAIALVLTTGAPITERALILALESSRAECAAEGGTELRYSPDLATPVDILGDGTADDRIISERSAFCGPDIGPLYAGSGGAPLHAVIGDEAFPLMPGAWTLQDVPFTFDDEPAASRRLLLVAGHGSYCDSHGAAPCVVAYGWDGARMISILDAFRP